MNRTTKELIAELRAEATKAEFVLLVVGFPTESKIVDARQPDAQEALDALVLEGGHPLGYLRSVRRGKQRSIESRVLPEYGDDPVPGQALQRLCEITGDALERQYGVYVNRGSPPSEV